MKLTYIQFLAYIGTSFAIMQNQYSSSSIIRWLLFTISYLFCALLKKQYERIVVIIIYIGLSFYDSNLTLGLVGLSLYFNSPYVLIAVISTFLFHLPNYEGFLLSGISLLEMIANKQTYQIQGLEQEIRILKNKHQSVMIRGDLERNSLVESQERDLELSVLNERNRIARDIHDNVGHLLSRSLLQVGALQSINTDEKLTEHYRILHESLYQGMTSIRNSVHNLYSDSLDFDDEICEIATSFPELTITVENHMQSKLKLPLQTTLLFIIKEALNNTHKHSDATNVSIVLNESPKNYYCIIHDNGSPNPIKEISGLGLTSIRKRVHDLNGILNIQNNQGFRIYVNIPKE
ncbi:sensor histidine kinase [Erysipelothrix anatis]|uniref:sensor histidine kinase n=1 Tax=Erysipelothrix anatis TaxID=2683713 RepID=UPI001359BB2E|nr:histidine kinase [Erysipelothrix anatis]